MDITEILSFAIEKEEEAAEFYDQLAAKVSASEMRRVFHEFARDERSHRAKLERIRDGGRLEPSTGRITDLKIADYLEDVEPGIDTNYQQALIIAMKREKRSYDLYSTLAEAVKDEALRQTFLALAQEEARHKLRLEAEYDDMVLTES